MEKFEQERLLVKGDPFEPGQAEAAPPVDLRLELLHPAGSGRPPALLVLHHGHALLQEVLVPLADSHEDRVQGRLVMHLFL